MYFKTYTMMLLMGMWTSLIKYPMKPIIAKPIVTACKIFMYSKKQLAKPKN